MQRSRGKLNIFIERVINASTFPRFYKLCTFFKTNKIQLLFRSVSPYSGKLRGEEYGIHIVLIQNLRPDEIVALWSDFKLFRCLCLGRIIIVYQPISFCKRVHFNFSLHGDLEKRDSSHILFRCPALLSKRKPFVNLLLSRRIPFASPTIFQPTEIFLIVSNINFFPSKGFSIIIYSSLFFVVNFFLIIILSFNFINKVMLQLSSCLIEMVMLQ